MALIEDFKSLSKDRQRPHGRVGCGYSVFNEGNETYLQLDTYGSSERRIPGNVKAGRKVGQFCRLKSGPPWSRRPARSTRLRLATRRAGRVESPRAALAFWREGVIGSR